jgi:hypothetical protein
VEVLLFIEVMCPERLCVSLGPFGAEIEPVRPFADDTERSSDLE